ncbi:MAG: hypothetical protein QXW77_00875 [Candidatus Hadarchaeales archaeon]
MPKAPAERVLRRRDHLLFLLLIPFLLVSIFLLPRGVKERYFVLRRGSLSGVLLSSYVHLETGHLENNLWHYLLVMLPILWLESDRRRFRRMMLLLFLLLPPLLSLSSLVAYGGDSWGFSGVVAGLIGYLPYCVYSHLRARGVGLNLNFLFAIFLANAALLFLLRDALLVGGTILLLSLSSLYPTRRGMREMVELLRSQLGRPRSIRALPLFVWRGTLILLSVCFLFYLPCLLPEEFVVGGEMIDVMGHFIGYVFGLFSPAILEARTAR